MVRELIRRILTSLVVALHCCLSPAAVGLADELGDAVRIAVSRVDPVVVRLRPIGSQLTADGDVVASVPTTGLVVSAAGEILTSAFALQGSPQAVIVERLNGERVTAQIVATDYVRKLVLLRATEGRWQAASAASRDGVQVGQWAVAVGRFYSSDSSNVSVGIVSAVNRLHGLALQTDAGISPMNYGGPLTDLQGNVLGILVPMSPAAGDSASAGVEWYDSGIGFAIPLEDAFGVLEQLRGGKDRQRGLMGVGFQGSSRFSPEIIVSRVHTGGPADVAGLKAGDRVVAIDGAAVDRAAVIESVVARSYAGDRIELDVVRDAQELSLAVELASSLPVIQSAFLGLLPIAPPATGRAAAAVGADLPEADVSEEQAGMGVEVIVLDQGPARNAGLRGRLEILSVGGTKTEDVAALTLAVRRMPPTTDIELRYRLPGEAVEQTVTVSSGLVPKSLSAISADDVHEYAGRERQSDDPATDVVRQEIDLAPSGRCILFHRRGEQQSAAGLILLVSASGRSEEALLRRWRRAILTHDLMVAVPVNSENTQLTVEDLPLVGVSTGRILRERRVDRSRLIVVAEAAQAALAARLLLTTRSPFQGVAMETGWLMPEKDGARSADVSGSVLLLEERSDLQQQAMQQQSATLLEKLGVMVLRGVKFAEGDERDSVIVQQVADWSLLLKCL